MRAPAAAEHEHPESPEGVGRGSHGTSRRGREITHRVPGDDGAATESGRGRGKRDAHPAREWREHPGREPGRRILLQQHDRDAARSRRGNRGEGGVAADADHEVRPTRSQYPPGPEETRRDATDPAGDLRRAATAQPAHRQEVHLEAGGRHRVALDPVVAADEGHRRIGTPAQFLGDGDPREQVPARTPTCDQNAQHVRLSAHPARDRAAARP